MVTPVILLGYISEMITHITGANKAAKNDI